MNSEKQTKDRLEYLRGELRAERISYGELHELQSLAEHIDPSDVELLEAAGVPEYQETKIFRLYIRTDSAAFGEDPAGEVARILATIAGKIVHEDLPTHYQTILDINGNDVGRYALKPETE